MTRKEEIRDALTAIGAKVDHDLNVANPNGGRPYATITQFGTADTPPIGEHEPGAYYMARVPNFGREIKLRPGEDVANFAAEVMRRDFKAAV